MTACKNQDWSVIIPDLIKHHNTLTKLRINCIDTSLSFITLFKNLQELSIRNLINGFELQHATFPFLRILKIPYGRPNGEALMKLLKNSGKNLNELIIGDVNGKSLKLSIAKFCPNLKKLCIILEDDEMDILKIMFNEFQYLESIKVWCGDRWLNEKELLEVVAKYSPKNFYELKVSNESPSELTPEDLESFFISWGNRIPQKSLTWIIDEGGFGYDEGNIATIEKYKRLGIIKKFEIKKFNEEE